MATPEHTIPRPSPNAYGDAPGRSMSNAVADAVAKVATAIGRPARLGVAFSGGVDSSVLLAVAVRALGPRRTLAILGVSPILAADERAAAHAVAAYIGAPILEIQTHEGDNPAYRANGPDRCFHCKDELFTRISDEVAARYGLRLSPMARTRTTRSAPTGPAREPRPITRSCGPWPTRAWTRRPSAP